MYFGVRKMGNNVCVLFDEKSSEKWVHINSKIDLTTHASNAHTCCVCRCLDLAYLTLVVAHTYESFFITVPNQNLKSIDKLYVE